MHEVLRALAEQLGPEVFDDPDHFRGALDDVLDEGASLGDQNLVVDAVRLGAFASMMTMLRQGGDPSSSVAQAGAMLARDRGGDDQRSASWACACLAYAVGAVDETEVHRYRTARRQPPPMPPPPAPPTVPVYSVPVPVPVPEPMGGRWLVPVLLVVALVAAATVGLLAAQRLGGDDDPASTPTDSETATTTPTTPPPTTPPPTTPPTTSPPTTPPTTGPTPVATTVEYTCGNGDCFLSERAGPRAGSPGRGTHREGARVTVVCQVVGQEIASSVLGTSSPIWARTSEGGYVAALFLSGIDKYAVTTPC